MVDDGPHILAAAAGDAGAQKANPAITSAQWNAWFVNLYQHLVQVPAISGLALQVHWDTVNPGPPAAVNAYDWTATALRI